MFSTASTSQELRTAYDVYSNITTENNTLMVVPMARQELQRGVKLLSLSSRAYTCEGAKAMVTPRLIQLPQRPFGGKGKGNHA